MSLSEVVELVAGAAVIGGGLLAVLWPGRRQGQRVLTRWGVDDPSGAEVADAVRYLKRRRLWYPWMFLAVSALVSSRGESGSWAATLLSTLVLGALLAEVVAQRPSRGLRREAALGPRSTKDVVSLWSMAAFAILAVVVVGVSALALAGAQWALRLQPAPGPVLVAALVVTVIGVGIVWLAVRRPAVGEPRADNALRLRSARVGAGLTMAALGVLFSSGGSTTGQFVVGAGVLCWIATVNPPRALRQAVVQA
jgi:hypothetical protein